LKEEIYSLADLSYLLLLKGYACRIFTGMVIHLSFFDENLFILAA